jgi:hypothetical protein
MKEDVQIRSRDLEFVAGDFFDTPIPKEQLFLLKYFKTELQLSFLKYYLVFGQNVANFVDHTGCYCNYKSLHTMRLQIQRILEAHEKAQKAMDFEALWKIEAGEYELKRKKMDRGS